MKKLRSGDPVIVISGKHKGKVSTIERFVDADHVIVAGVNEMKKAKKGEGFVTKLLPLHISTVQYYYADEKKGVRLEIIEEKGKKVRKIKKFGVKVD